MDNENNPFEQKAINNKSDVLIQPRPRALLDGLGYYCAL